MKLLIVMSFVLLLAACTVSKMPAGNFAHASDHFNQEMAKDTLSRLKTLHPPARSRLLITQPIKDAFGLTLIPLLRQAGYGVTEVSSKEAVPLSYVVDVLGKGKLYRVTLFVNSTVLTRAYGLRKGKLVPLSVWTKKD